jgi:phage-related minor tail protein
MPGDAKPFQPSREVIEQADAILNPRPPRRGGGGGGGGVSQADREAARIYEQTRTAAEKYAIELAKLNDLQKAGKLDTETYNRALEKLGRDLDKTGDLGKQAASAIRGAFDNLFDDPAAALKNLSKQLFQMALYAQLAKSMPSVFGSNGLIPLMNANGNAFDGGRVQAFAAGGIVSSATMFPMRGGMGVMGEAGPEAIMPLTRVGGKLGVAAAGGGGGGVKVEVNNYSGEAVTRTEGRGPKGEQIIRLAVGRDLASGNHDASLRSRFGTRPNPVKR